MSNCIVLNVPVSKKVSVTSAIRKLTDVARRVCPRLGLHCHVTSTRVQTEGASNLVTGVAL